MYELNMPVVTNVQQEKDTCIEWSNMALNDTWTSNSITKPVETQFIDSSNFSFNNYSDNNKLSSSFDYNSYYNQAAFMHSSAKQSNYYSLPVTSVANNQFNGHYVTQPANFKLNANFDCRHVAVYKNNETTEESNNSNRTSPLEHMNSLNGDSPASELVDSLEKTSNNNNNNSYDSNKENMNNDEINTSGSGNVNNIPAYFTTQKVVSNTVKLSYTAYQLELLNAIYTDMKYPNSVQKTLVAKLIGITRDQVKIWFQNRRRKDTLVSQGKVTTQPTTKSDPKKRRRSEEDFEQEQEIMPSSPESSQKRKKIVENQVINRVLSELRSHQNAPSRLSSKRTKTSNNKENSNEIVNYEVTETNRTINIVPVSNNIPIPDLASQLKSHPNEYTSQSSLPLINYSSSSCSSSSTSSSSSSSACSSEEDNIQNASYIPSKYQVLQQPFSIKEYMGNRYMPDYYRPPKVHNPYQPPAQIQPSQQHSNSNKLNSWATSIPQINYNQPAADYSKNLKYENNSTESSYISHQPIRYQMNSNNIYENPGTATAHYSSKYQPIQSDLLYQYTPQPNYQFLSNNLNSYNFCA